MINEIERLRDQLLTMTIHNEILQSQVNNLEFEKTDLQQQVTRTVTLAVEQEGAMANLEAKSSRLEAENSLLKTQVEAYTWPTAATDFSEMDFGETAFGGTYQSMVDGMGDGQQ